MRKTLSNRREKTSNEGSVSRREVVVSLGDWGREMREVRR